MSASQRSPADMCRWIEIGLSGAPVLLMDVTTRRQGRFIYGSSGAVAQGDAMGLPGWQFLAEEPRWQLRVPDFNLLPLASGNPSHVVQTLILPKSHGPEPGAGRPPRRMFSPVQGGSMGFFFGRGIGRAELSPERVKATSA